MNLIRTKIFVGLFVSSSIWSCGQSKVKVESEFTQTFAPAYTVVEQDSIAMLRFASIPEGIALLAKYPVAILAAPFIVAGATVAAGVGGAVILVRFMQQASIPGLVINKVLYRDPAKCNPSLYSGVSSISICYTGTMSGGTTVGIPLTTPAIDTQLNGLISMAKTTIVLMDDASEIINGLMQQEVAAARSDAISRNASHIQLTKATCPTVEGYHVQGLGRDRVSAKAMASLQAQLVKLNMISLGPDTDLCTYTTITVPL